ncbi:MAG: efflux RND transporter permease subunit, partial [Bdellovibrionota bacterium]
TLTPMRCAQFLTVGNTNILTRWVSSGMGHLANFYRGLLARCLKHRWIIIGMAFLVFGASLFTIKGLRKEFLPPQDQSRFIVNIYTKIGSSISFTDQVFREAEAFYRSRPEIKSYYVAVGGFGGGLVNQGVSFVTMKDPVERTAVQPFNKRPSQQEFMGFLRKELTKLPGVDRVSILDLSLTGFSAQRGYPIEFVVQGPVWDKLTELTAELKQRLSASGFMSDVDTDYNPNMPQVEVVPDRARAAEFGVNVTAIANTVAARGGGLKLLPNKYTDTSGHREDIQVKLRPEDNTDIFDIRNTFVENGYGKVVPLAKMISMEDSSALLTITRYNRERGISVFGNFAPGKSQSDVMDFIGRTAKEVLPVGYHVEFSGSSQAFSESFRSLMVALVLGIFVAYMVLATQFNSFLHPVIILLALPFSITGALLAMRLTGTSVNIYSLIGILLLMGIVKKNSILLVEFTNRQRHEGKNVTEALLAACPVRLRPILMTSVATIAGAIPEALASGSGSETIRPMAIAVIGGVMVSTLLTLIVVPCAYSLASRLEGTKHAKMLEEAEAALKKGGDAEVKAAEAPERRKSA